MADDQSYFSDPRASMSPSQRYRCVGPARHCQPLTMEPGCQTAPIQPSAQLSAATPPTTMEPSRKRRRTTAAIQHLVRRGGHSANGRWTKEAASPRMNRGHDDDECLYWTPRTAGQSASTTAAAAANFWKTGSTGPFGSTIDQSSGEFSPKSSCSTYSTLTLMSSSPDDSEPFDALGETERLTKIHDLAEEIVAREAAVRLLQHDADSHETSPSLGLATSSLMPLALAAGTSARASVTGQTAPRSQIEAPPAGTSSGPRSTSSSFATTAVGHQRVLTSSPSSSSASAAVASSSRPSGFGSSRRKMAQGVPSKSPEEDDPSFRGAVVRMQLRMVDGRVQLNGERYYNNNSRRRTHVINYSKHSDTDDDYVVLKEDDPKVRGKQCASCSTLYTPLWRDAEDGTPLCNACGIRYKKYKVHCNVCWHIPRKNENTGPHCKECGAVLDFVFRKSSMP